MRQSTLEKVVSMQRQKIVDLQEDLKILLEIDRLMSEILPDPVEWEKNYGRKRYVVEFDGQLLFFYVSVKDGVIEWSTSTKGRKKLIKKVK